MPESRLLNQLRRKLQDPATLVRLVGEEAVLSGIRGNIDKGDFAPLKEATRARKRDFAILKESNRLYDSFSPGSPENVSIVRGKEGTFGTRVPYAPILDSGTRNMPARRFLVVSPEMAREALETLSRTLLDV